MTIDSVSLIRLSGSSLVVAAASFLLFIVLYALLLPVNPDNSNYISLVSSKNWVLVNVVQQVGIAASILGTFGLIYGLASKLQWLGVIGLVAAIMGCVFMGGISFTETFLWPSLVRLLGPAEMAEVARKILSTSPYNFATMTGFQLFSLGYAIIGLGLLLSNAVPKWMPLCLILGCIVWSICLLFAGRIRYSLQFVAMMLVFCGGFVPIGLFMTRFE